ncbi:hypothetical protein EDD22DRAFT_846839 [Suillus occidentalis]|nr:hypothetical protein EDD22DRAFT_846839 [Suillus occidentalis]
MSALWGAKSETVQVDVAPGLPSHTRGDLERRLVRKLDLRMSVIVLLYALNYVDRANGGSVRLGGFEKDLHSHNVFAGRIQAVTHIRVDYNKQIISSLGREAVGTTYMKMAPGSSSFRGL